MITATQTTIGGDPWPPRVPQIGLEQARLADECLEHAKALIDIITAALARRQTLMSRGQRRRVLALAAEALEELQHTLAVAEAQLKPAMLSQAQAGQRFAVSCIRQSTTAAS